MHTFEAPNGTTFHHNNDYSGAVLIHTKKGGTDPVEIPFSELKAFIADYVRKERVKMATEELEKHTVNAILGLPNRKSRIVDQDD